MILVYLTTLTIAVSEQMTLIASAIDAVSAAAQDVLVAAISLIIAIDVAILGTFGTIPSEIIATSVIIATLFNQSSCCKICHDKRDHDDRDRCDNRDRHDRRDRCDDHDRGGRHRVEICC